MQGFDLRYDKKPYDRLLKVTRRELYRDGDWRLCERWGWHDNQRCLSILAWCWSRSGERSLAVIDYGESRSQAHVHLPWTDLAGVPVAPYGTAVWRHP